MYARGNPMIFLDPSGHAYKRTAAVAWAKANGRSQNSTTFQDESGKNLINFVLEEKNNGCTAFISLALQKGGIKDLRFDPHEVYYRYLQDQSFDTMNQLYVSGLVVDYKTNGWWNFKTVRGTKDNSQGGSYGYLYNYGRNPWHIINAFYGFMLSGHPNVSVREISF